MRGRKLLATALALGVVVGSFGVAEAAKKKKKPKPVPAPVQLDQKFFMRRDACEGAGADSTDNARLSLADGPDEGGNLCGWLESGVFNEILVAAGEAPTADVWPVADGLPLTLDATKAITGSITLVSSRLNAAPDQGVAAGQSTLVVDLVGTSGGEDVSIGTASVDYAVTPATSTYTVDFEIKVEGALDKKVLDSITMTTTIRGPMAGHGLYELDNPPSTVTIPAWVVQ